MRQSPVETPRSLRGKVCILLHLRETREKLSGIFALGRLALNDEIFRGSRYTRRIAVKDLLLNVSKEQSLTLRLSRGRNIVDLTFP